MNTYKMNFHTYIKAVGTGPKGNRNLNLEESQDMMQQILQGNLHSEQVSAFLLGWRMKPETIEEFQGSLLACDALIKQSHIKNSIELGYPFDGKAKNLYLFPLIAKILSQESLQMIVVGDLLQPAKGGVSTQDISNNIQLNSNLHYFDRSTYFKELHQLTQIRNRLGLRTGFNTLEKLPNVAKSDYAITGVFHKPYVDKYLKIFADKYKRFGVIQGNEGSPELFSKGTLWISQDAKVKEYLIDPAKYGISMQKSTEILSLKDSLHQLENPTNEVMKLAHLNAAIWLFISEKYSSIDEAYQSLLT